MTYLPRVIDQDLDELFGSLPAILIEGPKGVGKTATAVRRAKTQIRLDDPAQRGIIRADPALLLIRERPLLIDEWQLLPAVWDVVRRAVDENNTPGQFLLTGSANPANPATHSGAGRIVGVRMRPLALAERGVTNPTVSLRELLAGGRPPVTGTSAFGLRDYTREILASGFPGFRHLSGRALRTQLEGYVARIVDRDIPEAGYTVRRAHTVRRWLTAYAAATSTTASFEAIRDAATSDQTDKPARKTTIQYREILERLWIVDSIPAWTPSRNTIRSLTHAPKHQLADPALAAHLLGLTASALLDGAPSPVEGADSVRARGGAPRDGTWLGRLFEALVTLDIRVYAQAADDATVRHFRTDSGAHEADLIVVRHDRRVLAIEVKLGNTITDKDVEHLQWLEREIGDEMLDAIVINTGEHAYRRQDGIAVIPAALLGP
ncbi:MAG: DUF4143 domain-containing protein [Gemmatimonas sp.]